MAVLTLKPLFVDPIFKGKTILSSGDNDSPALVLLDDGETKGEVQFGNSHRYRIVGGAESNGFKIYSNDIEIMTLDDTGINITGAIKCTDTANSPFALKGASGGGGSNNLILLHSNSEMGTSSNVYDDLLDGTIIPDFTRHSPTLNVGLITRGIGRAQIKVIAQILSSITLPKQILSNIPVPQSQIYICPDKDDNILVPNYSANTISKILAGTTTVISIPVGANPQGICRDTDGTIYVGNYVGRTISKILAGSSVVSSTITLSFDVYDICLSPNGDLWLCAVNASPASVYKLVKGNTSVGVPITGFTSPRSMCTDPNENLYVIDGNAVKKVVAYGTTISATIAVGTTPTGICSDPNGHIYTSNSGSNTISKILAGTTTVISIPVGANPQGICSDPVGNIYVVNKGGGSISKINAGETTSSVIFTGLTNPQGICLDSKGCISVTSSNNFVTKIGEPVINVYQDSTTVAQEFSLVNSPSSDNREVIKIDCSTLPDISSNTIWNVLIQAKATSGDFVVKRFNMQSAPADFMVGTTVINSNPSSIISSPAMSLLETRYFPINYAIDNSCVLKFSAMISNGAGVASSEFKAVVTTTNGTSISSNNVTLTATSSGIVQGYIDFPNIVAPTAKVEIFGRIGSGTGLATLNHYELWLEV